MHSLSHLAQSNDRRLSAAGSVHSGGSDSTSGREVLKKCDVCASLGEERFYCGVCGDIFCNICWIQERAHRKAKEPVHGTPHEKLHYLKAEKIKTSLRQSAKLTDTRGMHDADESSLWFGVSLDPTDNVTPILEDTGRFAMLLAQTSAGDHKPRYPGLVSFIGQTGAGKSGEATSTEPLALACLRSSQANQVLMQPLSRRSLPYRMRPIERAKRLWSAPLTAVSLPGMPQPPPTPYPRPSDDSQRRRAPLRGPKDP